jgi:dihydropteroate synthase
MMLSARTVPPPVRVGTHHVHFENRTLVMGVLNVTPDSFSDGGMFTRVEDAVARGLQLLEDGADILDIGGESTRPGAAVVPVEEEIQRVVPVVRGLLERAPGCAISVDTRNAATAQAALDAGAGMVNDVSAATHDRAMLDLCVARDVPLVLMHMRGNPVTMQQGTLAYEDVVETVASYLEERAVQARSAGLRAPNIWVDPGFGFGKTVAHNLDLMTGIPRLCAAGYPVVWGPSRKSTLGWLAGGVPPQWRVHATVAACVMAVDRGAHVVRVHDVAAVRQALAVTDAARGVYMAPA